MKHAHVDIEELKQKFDIFLGGSRYMAQRAVMETVEPRVDISYSSIHLSADSDWDYYATHSPQLENEFLSRGWIHTMSTTNTKDTGESYLDSEAVSILEKDKHQIVLRKDANFYKEVFDSIPVWFYHCYLWKSSPHGGILGIERDKIQPIFEMLFSMKKKWTTL